MNKINTAEQASSVESINGWTPPTLYDIHTDTIRIATQQDVDRLQACEQMLGQMVSGMRKLLADFEAARQEMVSKIRDAG